ncbi:F-box/RNI-like superfamily protein [Rhynchospora pubera]|uniref:F-box/RNI-like superfamily protein n=1 Tax=Rhynchospora pubera TaxID=906938 RepID=A0AAV8ES76_9POAL|nr:F-box/RNI-like superfamily protein [Rhynchospora pubera]
MDGSQQKQGKVDEEAKDIISNLDETIKAKILSYLPIKEAIRTNILSSKWRYTWTTISELDIREDYFHSNKLPANRSSLDKFVDNLFLLHNGPIHSFKLSTKHNRLYALDRWIVNLSRNGISELTLVLTCKNKYKLHSSFFSCKNLMSVYLCNFSIKLPQDYEGFKLLSVLKFESCSLTGAEIERLVRNCALLKDLSLRKFRERSGLRIVSPSLERLSIDGNFTYLQLFTPMLARACVDLEKNPSGGSCVQKGGCRSNFSRAFHGVPEIKMLGIRRHFLQYLAQGNFLEEKPLRPIFSHLKVLTLDIDLSNPKEILAASFLFDNAPTLEELDVIISNSSEGNDGSASASFTFSSQHLKEVCLEDFKPNELDLAFVKSILFSSPLLQTLTISSHNPDYNKQAIVDLLYQSPRASNVVKISHL